MKPAENRPALGDHINHQKKLVTVRRLITSLEEKVNGQALIEGKAVAKIPSINGFETELEDLAAQELLGKITSAELKTRREEIAKRRAATERTAAAAEREVVAVRPALSGLRRLLEEAQTELKRLDEDTRDLRDAALVEQAEAIGAEYLAAAGKTWDCYMQLRALRDLLGDDTREREISGIQMYSFVLPTFNLKCFEGHGLHNWPGFLFNAELVASDFRVLPIAREAEYERLRALGI